MINHCATPAKRLNQRVFSMLCLSLGVIRPKELVCCARLDAREYCCSLCDAWQVPCFWHTATESCFCLSLNYYMQASLIYGSRLETIISPDFFHRHCLCLTHLSEILNSCMNSQISLHHLLRGAVMTSIAIASYGEPLMWMVTQSCMHQSDLVLKSDFTWHQLWRVQLKTEPY